MVVETVRIAPDSKTVHDNLGLLRNLSGTWIGEGFNLIARPDFHDTANLYLQLNQTHETLHVEPIGSAIPNRGFGQDDIELFGLTYLQKISDVSTGGGLHIEPGIWVTQPATNYPDEAPPAQGQIVFRLGSIPHGNALLAQGSALPFEGPPTLTVPPVQYAFSQFPSFNSTPFPIPAPPASPIINAAGSSEALTAPVPPGFTQYDLLVPASAANPRTPFGTTEPPLPASINGVAMQDVINDPITLLQAVIQEQVGDGHTFRGTVLNIATQPQITFFDKPNSKAGDAATTVDVPDAGGGVENILFLDGVNAPPGQGPNAETSLVYATFWIEEVMPHHGHPFMQLQYAQMTVLDFAILKALPNVVDLGWPHVSVATLRKSFS